MSIKAYVGRMGSGKTYEVVSSVVLPALARGRRVVSNIAGLNQQAFIDLLTEQGISPDLIGELVQVEHTDVLEPAFWRTDKDRQEGIDAFIQPGDLLALDEIWRFWDGFADRKQPDRVMNFFRMHRHFTHAETGIACDVVLITQDVMDISRRVRAVIEETYSMEKLTAVGSAKRYRVDIFQGGKTTRKPLRQIQRSYKAEFFPLYSSHSQQNEGDAAAKEENIDGRGNILKGGIFTIVLPLGVLVLGFSAWFIYRTLHPAPKLDQLVEQSKTDKAKATKPDAQDKPPSFDDSSNWRASGFYSVHGSTNVVLIDQGNLRVLVNPPAVKLTAVSVESFLPSGEAVTSWTGSTKKSALPSAVSQ